MFFDIWLVVIQIFDYFIVASPVDLFFDICLGMFTFYFCLIAVSKPHFRHTKIIFHFFTNSFFGISVVEKQYNSTCPEITWKDIDEKTKDLLHIVYKDDFEKLGYNRVNTTSGV